MKEKNLLESLKVEVEQMSKKANVNVNKRIEGIFAQAVAMDESRDKEPDPLYRR